MTKLKNMVLAILIVSASTFALFILLPLLSILLFFLIPIAVFVILVMFFYYALEDEMNDGEGD